MNRLINCIYLIALINISACSDSSNNTASTATVASVNAGVDQVVFEGQAITLTATGYPDGGTAVWTQTQGSFIDGFPTEDELSIEVESPSISVDTKLTFQVEYTSPDGQIAYDEVNVQVTNVDYAPIVIIKLEDDAVTPFSTYEVVTVSGADSYHQDGVISSYLWTQIDSNEPLNISSETTQSELIFTAPFVKELTTYTLQLTLTDSLGTQGVNTIDILIAGSGTSIAANAGYDQIVDEFTTVTLDGSNSASSESDVICRWSQQSGSSITFDDEQECVTTFVAPDIDTQQELVLQLTVYDSAGNTGTDDVTVIVEPISLGLLHDTGITECFSDSATINCGDAAYPNQDGEIGRDYVGDNLSKFGKGNGTFDFTKLNDVGDEISDAATDFSCIRDNFTDLIWEVKQEIPTPAFSSFRGADNYYSIDSTQAAGVSCSSNVDCGAENFIDEVNDSNFCGGANWRLPTYLELLNILDYDNIDSGNLFPTDFFMHTPNSTEQFYWVSDDVSEGEVTDFYFVIDAASGDDSVKHIENTAYVILVRTQG